jgi:hypothetical protein
MASKIRIKRSTGNVAPGSLLFGELGLTIGSGTQGNKGERLFVGDDSGNVDVVGGRYYTDLMAHGPGLIASQANPTTAGNGFVAIVDQNRKVDEWNVDNLTLDGNVLSSTDTDGDIVFHPNGSGEIMIPDDTFLGFGGGANGTSTADSKIEYDENGTDQLTFTGADVRFNIETNATSKDTGAVIVEGGVGIEKDLHVGGGVVVAGIVTFSGSFQADAVGISSNVISTLPGSGNVLYLDPYPDGLSNEGQVVIKGDLQVDGTTTVVNSTAVSVNDPIYHVGDVTSNRTVRIPVIAGVSTVNLDSVVGINTGDHIAATSIAVGGIGTVTAIDIANKTVTYNGTAQAPGITTTSQVVITHGYDTNTDRGISFNYNTGSGIANNKVGFFGFDDSATSNSSVSVTNHGTHGDGSRKWTYIPDATINASVVTGTKGFLDVKGIYYQSGNFNTGGAVYFDSDGLQRTTNSPTDAANTLTSTQILTAVSEVALTVASSSYTQGAQITQQNNSSAYGVVKTTVSSGTTLTLIGVQGTFNTTDDLVVNGTTNSITPSAMTPTYTNKPTWTDTLDGGTF